MRQAVLRIAGLPEGALDAAGVFHGQWLSQAREALNGADALAMIFAPASYDHRGWRLAAMQDLAREAAPKRVNGIVGNAEQALAQTIEWLAQASGVTGQLLAVD